MAFTDIVVNVGSKKSSPYRVKKLATQTMSKHTKNKNTLEYFSSAKNAVSNNEKKQCKYKHAMCMKLAIERA